MNRLTACLLTLLFPPLLLAQEVLDTDAPEEVRRYMIEVIIFRYAENVGVGSEVFLPDAPVEPVFEDDPGMPVVLDAGPDKESGPLPDIELVLLAEKDYRLDDTYARLERLDAYEPLMHFGWTQATWPKEQTEAIPLHLFARPPEELDGRLTLYLNRYLHLIVDLQLRAPESHSNAETTPSGFDNDRLSSGDAIGVTAPPVFFRIFEDRILRNGELRYYDHPRFGLLATVTRVEEKEPAQGELLGYPLQ